LPPGRLNYFSVLLHSSHNAQGEDNDTCPAAYPIPGDVPWTFLPNDRHDWYRVTLGQGGLLTVALTDFVPQSGQLAVYKGLNCGSATFLGNNGTVGQTKMVNLGNQTSGIYYVYVSNDGELNYVDEYTLEMIVE
jgi:hypothetical protein